MGNVTLLVNQKSLSRGRTVFIENAWVVKKPVSKNCFCCYNLQYTLFICLLCQFRKLYIRAVFLDTELVFLGLPKAYRINTNV